MAAMPESMQPDGLPADASDREMWVLFCALIAHRPALTAAIAPIEASNRDTAEARIASTVLAVEKFTEEARAFSSPADGPTGVGSTRAVAASVVRLCRIFTEGWSHATVVTTGRALQFNAEVALLEGCLDGIATRFADWSR